MASPKLTAADSQTIKDLLLQFAVRSPEGKAFFAATGFSALRDLAPGLMESMDAYGAATRKVLAAPS